MLVLLSTFAGTNTFVPSITYAILFPFLTTKFVATCLNVLFR